MQVKKSLISFEEALFPSWAGRNAGADLDWKQNGQEREKEACGGQSRDVEVCRGERPPILPSDDVRTQTGAKAWLLHSGLSFLE